MIKNIFTVATTQVKLLGNMAHNEQGLLQFWAFEKRQARTEVDNCNIADVLFISQIYNVLLELKHNSEQNVDPYFVKPKLQQT